MAKKTQTIVVSFSGGETSGYMAWFINYNLKKDYNIINIFANTGDENEETLIFADKCDKHFGLNLIWVEGVTNSTYGKGVSAKVVTFETASRKAEPFKAMVHKHGIPNITSPFCSKELKQRAIKAYLRSQGLNKSDYRIAIGIRRDEIDRISKERKKENLWYPLIEEIRNHFIDKPFINRWWRDQPFRLQLKGYEGNCRVCWKKSLRKLLTIAKETPEAFTHFAEMESNYENYIPKSKQHNKKIKTPIRFYRDNLSVNEILELSKQQFEPAKDDSKIFHSYVQTELFGHSLDVSNGCIESCEVF